MTEHQIESEVKIRASVNESDDVLSSWVYIIAIGYNKTFTLRFSLYNIQSVLQKSLLLCFHVTGLGSVLLESDVLNE